MLVLTENASAMIREILDRPNLPEGSGLRITGEPEAGGNAELSLKAAASARRGDQVIETEGARVFLGPTAAEILQDKVLDAAVETSGKVRFLVSPQQ